MSPQRRKTVVLCAAAACVGGGIPVLTHHPRLQILWLCLELILLVLAVTQFVKLKKEGR